ncbi:MAG: prepilin-type N-terminal cleavage/methylation domain-containing protein [Zoogloeaceae bacterium]|jgi:prepilin-type N-terminal cleavage/methylation domain-containing protein|nr:prepilin-type N-terminal cleavage/methylation domain-containing protein [Zoogloeaceae bacterium]
MPFSCRRSPRGFTLLELAVVLLILALLLGGLILPLAAQREARQWRAAQQGLAEIQAALLGYAVLYGHLPCPDAIGDGVAADSCAAPPAHETLLPFKSLGLNDGNDPWGARWRYRVDAAFASAENPVALSTGFSAARLKVVNLQDETLNTDKEYAIAIVHGFGPNGKADGQNALFSASDARYQSGPPTPEFDDAVVWLARPALFARRQPDACVESKGKTSCKRILNVVLP